MINATVILLDIIQQRQLEQPKISQDGIGVVCKCGIHDKVIAAGQQQDVRLLRARERTRACARLARVVIVGRPRVKIQQERVESSFHFSGIIGDQLVDAERANL